jgi:hypothetical protein
MRMTRETNAMRSQMLLLLIIVGLLAAGRAQAQTWASPLGLYYAAFHEYSGNTCDGGNTIAAFQGFDSPGRDVVYRLSNTSIGIIGQKLPHFGDTFLTLYPAGGPQDVEVWVCASNFGVFAENCVIEADNINSGLQPIAVYIPAAYKTYHIIVTSGNAGFGANYCEPYTLDVQRLP